MLSKSCLLLMIAAAVAPAVKGTAEVMSHVTAHFGKALEECREEVSFVYFNISQGDK